MAYEDIEIGEYDITGDALVEGDDPEFAIDGEGDDDDMLTGDDLAIIGAISRRNPMFGRRMSRMIGTQRALRAKQVQNSVLVKRKGPKDFKKRIYMIGFDSVATIAVGATTIQTQTPQVPFKGTRLLVPAAIAASFSILDFRIGIHPQIITSTGVPAQSFSENVTDNDMDMNTASPGILVSLTATNIGAAPTRFQASIRGVALQD